jgi:hypothetical protein
MASGHVNRTKRPNTWLHRPTLQNVKKALANPEPSTHGTFRTCRDGLTMSVDWGIADLALPRIRPPSRDPRPSDRDGSSRLRRSDVRF